jgi:hypothetical protein
MGNLPPPIGPIRIQRIPAPPIVPRIDSALERTSRRVSWVWPMTLAASTIFSSGFAASTYLSNKRFEPMMLAIKRIDEDRAALDTRLRSIELTLAGVQGQVDVISKTLGVMPVTTLQEMKRINNR